MGGGMVLMALYGFLLPLNLAMILHGVTQLFANGFRAQIHKEHIQWPVVPKYILGVAVTFAILKFINFVPNKATVFILLGVLPFFAFLPIAARYFDILKPGRSFWSGVFVTIAQVSAGASGSILDIFYLNSTLKRHQIIATKALTQTIGHSVKVLYYSMLLVSFSELTTLPLYIYLAVIVLAYLGTRAGKLVLDRINEKQFRTYSFIVVYGIALFLLYKGIGLALG